MANKTKSAHPIKIGISIGDLNGIGIETIIKTFTDSRIFNFCCPIIYGSAKVINYYKTQLEIENLKLNVLQEDKKLHPKALNVVNCWEEDVKIEIGKASPENGLYPLKSIDAALTDLKSGKIEGIVTAPINKDLLNNHLAEKFVGHTEYLAQNTGGKEPLMLMVSDDLRVAVTTGHISVSEIKTKITSELIVEKLEILKQSLIKDFAISNPKIAVLGLNPHAGDNGLLGSEEQEIIIPALEKAKEKKIFAIGPFSADGYFGSDTFKKYDAVLAMYHDQGLAPFKAMAFETGVNFTAGLPIVRTSPDHGPAYNLAGKNKASEASFRSALFLAIDVIRNRYAHQIAHQNPLDRTALFKGMDNKTDKKNKKTESAEVKE